MELKEFNKLMSEQFDDYDVSKLNINTTFRDLDSYDSLTGMAMIVIIEDEFGVDISPEEFKNLKTVSDIFNFIFK